jgi:pimeloyl-ACP methyl ester carboxylesterase
MTSTSWPAVRPPGPGHLRPMPSVPGVTHHFCSTRGANFHVAQAGSGDPVVLLHGVPQHWYVWCCLIPELATRYQLFCIDLRGCGWSEGTNTGYDTDAQSRDLLAVMDELGLERAHLIGHQYGGWIGFRLCLMAPERFSGFLALNVTHPWPGRAALIRHAWRFWYTAFWEYPAVGRVVLRRWPGFTRMLLRRWAGPSRQWDPATLDDLFG